MRQVTVIAFAAAYMIFIGQNTASIISLIGVHQPSYILSSPTVSVVNVAQPYDEGQWKAVSGLEGEYVSGKENEQASISLIERDNINDIESSNASPIQFESKESVSKQITDIVNATVESSQGNTNSEKSQASDQPYDEGQWKPMPGLEGEYVSGEENEQADDTTSKDGSNSVIMVNESEESVSKQITDIISETAEGYTNSEKSQTSDQPYDEGQWKPVPGLEGEYVSGEENEQSDDTTTKNGPNSVIMVNESEESVSKQITDIISASDESAEGNTNSTRSHTNGGEVVSVTESKSSTTSSISDRRGNTVGSIVIAEDENIVDKTTENGDAVAGTGLIYIIKGGSVNGATKNHHVKISDCVDCIGGRSEVAGGSAVRGNNSDDGVDSKSAEIDIGNDGNVGAKSGTGELHYIGVNVGAKGPCAPSLLWL